MMTLLFANSIMIINISVQTNDCTVVLLNEEFDAFLGVKLLLLLLFYFIYML